MSKENILAVLDIGTSKISTLVGEVNDDGGVEVIGVGVHPARGVKDGVVVNIEEAASSIRKSVEDAELMADVQIGHVIVGISGNHIKCDVVKGEVPLKNMTVQKKDVSEAIDSAMAITLPSDREYVGIRPVEFILDGKRGIKEPLGMAGRKLEVKVLVITASASHLQDLHTSCRRAGLKVAGVDLNSIASGEAVLTPDERELGACVVDVGSGTTKVAAFCGGNVISAFEIPVGGRHITRDLAAGLATTLNEAERVKKSFGSATRSGLSRNDEIEVESLYADGRMVRVSRRRISEIIEPRIEEILEFVDEFLVESGVKDELGAGVVLTGGTSLLPGITELARGIFDMPVRTGRPTGLTGLAEKVSSPAFSSGVGLLISGLKEMGLKEKGGMRRRTSGSFFERVRDFIESWF